MQTHNGIEKLADLRPPFVTEIKEFFVTYNKLRGRMLTKSLAFIITVHRERHRRKVKRSILPG